jgi:hypothetical protein
MGVYDHAMSNDERYYRQQVVDAQQHADRAISDMDRANWLRIAQSWMALIRGRQRSAEEAFDDSARDQGTGQDVSKDSQ